MESKKAVVKPVNKNTIKQSGLTGNSSNTKIVKPSYNRYGDIAKIGLNSFIPGIGQSVDLYRSTGFTNQPIGKDQIEALKTPFGSFTLKKDYVINSVLGIGGFLLVIIGLIALIWPSKEQVTETIKTVGKVI